MSETILFESTAGHVTTTSFRQALLSVGAHEADILYIHSGLTFGHPSKSVSRADLLALITEEILDLQVGTVCMPTFTFSFCNGEDFNLDTSRSHMGALNEHFRKRDDAVRSADPLMSVALVGRDIDLVQDLGIQSTGKDSNFDKINGRSNVKFLFLGVHPGDCFTYMHYLEWKAGVPYRYDRSFSGNVVIDGISEWVTKELFVRFDGVVPNRASYVYGDMLRQNGSLRKMHVGDSSISCVALEPARELYLDLLDSDPNYFITEPFDASKVTDKFIARKMVAL